MQESIEYKIKRADANDIHVIASLASIVGKNSARRYAEISEKFARSISGPGFIGYIAYAQNVDQAPPIEPTPAAYYGIFLGLVNLGGREILAGQSGDTMTHPDHRGKGLFVRLAEITYQTAKQEGVEFVYGIPNSASHHGFAKRLNWKFPFKMRTKNIFVPTIPVGLLRRRYGNRPLGFGSYSRKLLELLFNTETPDGILGNRGRSENGCIRDTHSWTHDRLRLVCIRHRHTGIILKYDGDLGIGEISGEPSKGEVISIVVRLLIVAILLGSIRIKSFFSPETPLEMAFSKVGGISESMWFGYLKLAGDDDPSMLKLSYFDYDTY